MNPQLHCARSFPRQRGFTLVEITVAMLIGLFLLGGLLVVVQDNKRTFANQNQMTQVQDVERLAMTMIANVIQSGGYFPNPQLNTLSGSLPAITAPVTMSAGQFVYGTGSVGDAAPGNVIYVRYTTQGGATGDPNQILTCNGAYNQGAAGTTTMYTSEFWVDSTKGMLVCTLKDHTAGTTKDYPLVGGPATNVNVTSLQVSYGYHHGATGDSADSYYDATQINAIGGTAWSNIVSVKVTLTLQPLAVAAQKAPAALTFTRVIGLNNAGGATS